MLKTSLDSHPEIKCYGEVFNPAFGNSYTKYVRRSLYRRILERLLRDYLVVKYLDTLFSQAPQHSRAIGFKVMYPGQFNRCANFRYYWQENGFHVIRLSRKNLLRRFVSAKIALLEGQWSAKSVRKEPCNIEVDEFELSSAFHRMKALDQSMASLAMEFKNVWVEFEELIESPSSQIRRICDFLGVSEKFVSELRPTTMRQNPQHLSKLINNYDSLRERFSDTEYAWMFG